jgi:5-methylcytosine-specific restriction endonuclease McrA
MFDEEDGGVTFRIRKMNPDGTPTDQCVSFYEDGSVVDNSRPKKKKKKKKKRLILWAELVPQTAWGSNLRNNVSQQEWDTIRRKVYAEYDHKCGVCEDDDTILHCHEIWKYSTKKKVQRLAGMIALCPLCHHVKHIGRAGVLANEGKLDYQQIVDHFCRVNRCSKARFENHLEAVFKKWEERSQHEWDLDLGEWAFTRSQ